MYLRIISAALYLVICVLLPAPALAISGADELALDEGDPEIPCSVLEDELGFCPARLICICDCKKGKTTLYEHRNNPDSDWTFDVPSPQTDCSTYNGITCSGFAAGATESTQGSLEACDGPFAIGS